MDIERARYLVSERGRDALASLPRDLPADPNRRASLLRRKYPAAEAAALAEQVTLCVRAARNHGSHRGMLFTAPGLEMMTHPLVAERRARRIAALHLPFTDLTCGLGGDLKAVAEAGVPASGIEIDAPTALLAQHNVVSATISLGDAGRPPLAVSERAVLVDPSRREGGSRRFDPSAFSPPWDVALAVVREAAAAVIKAPPGLQESNTPADAELEAIQLGTSMREISLWFGGALTPGLRRAVLLPAGAELSSDEPEAIPGTVPPSHILFDPESCVTRATLVRHLGHRLGARLMDEQVAYLVAPVAAFSPLAATFEVLDRIPFSLSRLRQRLREANWKPDEIRRRAFPVEPDELRRLLSKLEGEPVTLLLTTLAGARTVFIARRLFAPA
jgi:hypothetical protein